MPTSPTYPSSPKRPGAPRGNTNALKHGFYSQAEGSYSADPIAYREPGKAAFYAQDPAEVTIDQAIAGLVDKMTRLDQIIAEAQANGARTGSGDLVRLFELYTQASSRLSRMLRDRRALSGEAADGISGAIAQAMDELGTEMGVDLT